jgi:hypothetical protein
LRRRRLSVKDGVHREHTEDQLGALGLVVNVVVLWNTRYLDATLAQVRASSISVSPADVERLSPLLLDPFAGFLLHC